MTSRLHPFDGIDNFRDFGDYPTAAGARVRPGRLFRSAHHARVSDADLARLAAMDFGAVVDLRYPVERRRQPSRRPEGFSAAVIASDIESDGEAPHIAFLKSAVLTPDSGRRFMIETYRRMPFTPSHQEVFGAYFRALADNDRPVLIHCAAGKDRTGLLAALTHHLLGVGRDDLIADYLLTNVAVDLEARAPAIAEQLETMTGRLAAPDAVVAFMGVEPAYLDAALTAMVAEHGSIDAYLEVLGVDGPLRDRIGDRLAA